MINFTGLNITKAARGLQSVGHTVAAGGVKMQSQLNADVFEKTPNAIFCEKTFNEAKNFVMQSILSSSPKESVVCIKDDKIVYKTVGDRKCVSIGDIEKILNSSPKNSIAIVHSHPTMACGNALPITIDDFEVLNSHPALRSIYAINSDGEYSLLEKNGDKMPSSIATMMLRDTFWDSLRIYAKKIKDPAAKKFCRIYPKINSVWRTSANKERLEEELASLVDIMQNKEYGAKLVHQFWQEYADVFCVKYETNFSRLC